MGSYGQQRAAHCAGVHWAGAAVERLLLLSSQMAASKGKDVVQPPAPLVIMRTHARSASMRFSLRAADLRMVQCLKRCRDL